jgi:hypothetical protein
VRGDGLDPHVNIPRPGKGAAKKARRRYDSTSRAEPSLLWLARSEENPKGLLKVLARATYKTNRIFHDGVKITADPYAL